MQTPYAAAHAKLHAAASLAELLSTAACALPVQAAKSEPEGQRTFSEEEVQQMEVLWEKVRLQLAFAAS